MKINGIDISVYKARQHKVTMDHASVSNGSEWVDGDVTPIMLGTTYGFKKIKVEVILEGESRDEIWKNGSNLVAALMAPCTIELDGFSNYYKVCLQNVGQTEQNIKRWHKAQLEFIGYEFSEAKTVVQTREHSGIGTDSFVVINNGNIKTPVILEVQSSVGVMPLSVYGLTNNRLTGERVPIQIGLPKDSVVVVDGETGLITKDREDAPAVVTDYSLPDLPTLEPGENTITTSFVIEHIKITYRERFL